ncbi:MAG: NAD(+)/NADH kinase [Desulfobacterales bacterium]|nr:MAG: NAD(+)/NADH kinase [Desulfobacterales bacterium]
MRYAIVTNPASGKMNADQRRSILAKAAKVLGAKIYGMDTTTVGEFKQCAHEVAAHCDVLVVAGGDGTLSDIINSVDTVRIPLAYLPLGTGNAMRHALRYQDNIGDIARRIKHGSIHEYDLINCDDRVRAFMVSVGIEGEVIRLRNQYVLSGDVGLKPYVKAVVNSYFKKYKRANASIIIDGRLVKMGNILSLMVVKQPYYGFGMEVVPKAQFDDRKLHLVCTNLGLFGTVISVISAFTVGNRAGKYYTGLQIDVRLDRALTMQYDGNEGWQSERFTFTVLPRALKIKC